jgi:predicted RNase H-like HicB family nuclease
MVMKVRLYTGEDGFVVAECPALPGCVTQGKSRAEALATIREAIAGWLEVQESRSDARQDVEVVELSI